MRVRVSSLPMPRRVTLRHKLASLVGGIGILVVMLTTVGVANLGNVSDHGQQTFTRVTKPLASLGRARALLNDSATLADRHMLEDTLQDKQAREQRIAANGRAVDH